MFKKANSSSNGKRKGDGRDHKDQNITDNYNISSINISRCFSGGLHSSLQPTYSGSGSGEPELLNLSGYEDCFDCFHKLSTSDSSGVSPASLSPNNCDMGPEEPELSKLFGYDDCETCYDRLSFIKRITEQVKELQGGDF